LSVSKIENVTPSLTAAATQGQGRRASRLVFLCLLFVNPSLSNLSPVRPAKPLLVGTICDSESLSAAHALSAPPSGPDVLEVRIDQLLASRRREHAGGSDVNTDELHSQIRAWLEECVLETTKNLARRPIILTVRDPREGGGCADLNPRQRLKWYETLLAQVDYVDLELASLRSQAFRNLAQSARRDGKKVIGSVHDFQKTPSARGLQNIVRRASESGLVDICKIAVTLNSVDDLCRILSLLRTNHSNLNPTEITSNQSAVKMQIAVMGMGESFGKASRVSAAALGSALNYGYLGTKSQVPGQWPVALFRQCIDELF
jgi:3-dehydroquinate dehydratase I